MINGPFHVILDPKICVPYYNQPIEHENRSAVRARGYRCSNVTYFAGANLTNISLSTVSSYSGGGIICCAPGSLELAPGTGHLLKSTRVPVTRNRPNVGRSSDPEFSRAPGQNRCIGLTKRGDISKYRLTSSAGIEIVDFSAHA